MLLASATGRQAATPTARLQTQLTWKRAPVSLLTPTEGAFNCWTATLLDPRIVVGQRSIANPPWVPRE
ncbi:hypothetical protein [Sphingomonas sp. Leaf22]|uniref:hypothetical protein n=1 Tax=Sphingomonas sp. Leaf22 TaxID=1735687 RepID=UPI0019105262|nr:hypothetical protein [Sphingomonas sp. Leaf22]